MKKGRNGRGGRVQGEEGAKGGGKKGGAKERMIGDRVKEGEGGRSEERR